MVKFDEKFKTAGAFELIPEGEHVLLVKELKPIKQSGKLKEYKLRLVDSKGRSLFNTYNMNPNAQYYEASMRAFYSLLKTGCALDEDADGNIDEAKAVGKYIIAKVKHTQGSNDRTYANLGYIQGHAEGFSNETAPATDIVSEEDEDEDPYA